MCHDIHDCSIGVGDAWLQAVVPVILAQPEFQPGGAGVLFITFDEGFGANRVATVVVGPQVKPGYHSSVPQGHYSLLRTIEETWGLDLLRNAANAASMMDFFQ